jgi:hypothetical protein
MLRQLLCWLKTKHKHKISHGLFVKRVNVEWEQVFVKYECTTCGVKFNEWIEDKAYWNKNILECEK